MTRNMTSKSELKATTDPLERVIRPIVEGQLRGFAKEHPGVLNGVTWCKGKKHGQIATFVNSAAKRVVRDLLCETNRMRIEQAFFDLWEAEKSAVEPAAAADGEDAETSSGIASPSLVELDTANEIGPVGTLPDRVGSHPLLPPVYWGTVSRQFGLSSRPADGEIQRGGPLLGDAEHTPNSSSVAAMPSLRRINSGGQRRQPFIDQRELLAGLLFFLIPLAAALVVLAVAFVYAAFVA